MLKFLTLTRCRQLLAPIGCDRDRNGTIAGNGSAGWLTGWLASFLAGPRVSPARSRTGRRSPGVGEKGANEIENQH